ncbi:MAG: O-methyltransferase [Gemmatimonadales bacterium]
MLYAARQVLRIIVEARDRRRLRTNVPDLAAALERSGTAAERDCWKPIERRRAELLASADVIPFPEYGAGTLWPGATPGTRRVDELTRVASKPRRWGEVLFHLVRTVQPRVALELGTCVGVSGAYQAAALKLNGAGTLLTFEGAEAAARIAGQGFRALGLDHHVKQIVGPFAETLPGVLQTIDPIGYAFIDGHHEEVATLTYYRALVAHLDQRALLVFDDIRWSEGMTRAWRTIAEDPAVTVSVDCGSVGICLRDPTAPAGRYRVRVSRARVA